MFGSYCNIDKHTNSQNTIILDAKQLYDMVFIETNSDNLKTLDFTDIELRTFFELLIIITVNGIKYLFYNNAEKINIELLTENELIVINKYLSKINIRLDIEIITEEQIKNKSIMSYKDIIITNRTKLEELKYLLYKSNIFMITFHRL